MTQEKITKTNWAIGFRGMLMSMYDPETGKPMPITKSNWAGWAYNIVKTDGFGSSLPPKSFTKANFLKILGNEFVKNQSYSPPN